MTTSDELNDSIGSVTSPMHLSRKIILSPGSPLDIRILSLVDEMLDEANNPADEVDLAKKVKEEPEEFLMIPKIRGGNWKD